MGQRIVIDIDGTICTQEKNYANAIPYAKVISHFNKLFDEGVEIVYFTARGTETGLDWGYITEEQFKEWGVKYTELIFGKPAGDLYIDDKAININQYINEEIKK